MQHRDDPFIGIDFARFATRVYSPKRMNISERQLDRTLIALADPTRRALLAKLTSGEARVTDLAKPFALSLNTVSKHLKSLERAGLVKRRRVGREQWLTLRPAPLDDLARWIDEKRALWSFRLKRLETLLQEEDSDD